ncbi:MAG: hypothetical protein JWN56_1922 [Sphingobacteriales bacterium]|nr:hypothetical protein [Sphingobacteriales bacterium]
MKSLCQVKLVFLFSLFMIPSISFGSGGIDTAKYVPVFAKAGTFAKDYSTYLEIGINYIKRDSIEQGIKFLSEGFEVLNSEKKIFRVSDYHFLEVASFLQSVAAHKVTDKERQLFVKLMYFMKNKPNRNLLNIINTYLHSDPNSVFAKRLKLFCLTLFDTISADKYLDELLQENSDLVSLKMLKAELCLESLKMNDAVLAFTEVIRLDPTSAYAYNSRGKCYEILNIIDSVKSSPMSVINDYTKAIELYPDFMEASISLAKFQNKRFLFKESISTYSKVLKSHPKHMESTFTIGLTYYNLQELDSALFYVSKCINLNPKYVKGYKLKGDIYFEKSNFPEAIQCYSKAIDLVPDQYEYYENRGSAYYLLNNIDLALEDFMSAYKRNSTSVYTLNKLGDCYFTKKEYTDAISWYLKATKAQPKDKVAYFGLGCSYNKKGKYNQAIDVFQKALAIDSTYDDALGNMAWAYYGKGDFDQCITLSEKAIHFNKNAVYYMFNIPLAYLRSGQVNKAKSLYIDYVNYCIQNKFVINDGAITNLKDLIDKNIQAEDAKFILKYYFKIDFETIKNTL